MPDNGFRTKDAIARLFGMFEASDKKLDETREAVVAMRERNAADHAHTKEKLESIENGIKAMTEGANAHREKHSTLHAAESKKNNRLFMVIVGFLFILAALDPELRGNLFQFVRWVVG